MLFLFIIRLFGFSENSIPVIWSFWLCASPAGLSLASPPGRIFWDAAKPGTQGRYACILYQGTLLPQAAPSCPSCSHQIFGIQWMPPTLICPKCENHSSDIENV